MRTLLVIVGTVIDFVAFLVALFASIDLFWLASGVQSFGDGFDPTRVIVAVGALAFATVLTIAIFWQLRAPRDQERRPDAYESPLTWHQRLFAGLSVRVLGASWAILGGLGAFAYLWPRAVKQFVDGLTSMAPPGQ